MELQCHYNMPSFFDDDGVLRNVLYDFSVTVKAAPHECVLRTGQP